MGHSYDYTDEDIGRGIDEFSNVLGYNLEMTKNVWEYDRDIEYCLQDAVAIAREFVDAMHPTATSTHEPTHKLAESINYSITPTAGSGYAGGRLYANAVDNRGHPYAGHIEYGFTDRIGIPHGPWPFLRPAMRLAAAASQKNFGDTLSQIITQGFSDTNVIRFGSHDAYNNIANARAVPKVARTYGKTAGGTGKWSSMYGSRWSNAKNGIGFKSGVRDSNYSDRTDYEWGVL